MKKLIIFIALVFAISCKTMCGDDEFEPSEAKDCNDLETSDDNKNYCCYYTGTNVENSSDPEKYCWEFLKTDIDNDKVYDTIKAIEDGKDSHTGGKKKKDVKLDCFASYLKNYFLLGLLLLF